MHITSNIKIGNPKKGRAIPRWISIFNPSVKVPFKVVPVKTDQRYALKSTTFLNSFSANKSKFGLNFCILFTIVLMMLAFVIKTIAPIINVSIIANNRI